MKKIILILILYILSCFNLGAQKISEPNTLYLVFQPFNEGVGIRYDRIFNSSHKLFGIYGSWTNREFELENGKIKHTNKIVTGVLLYSNPYNKNFNLYFGTGVAHNIYGGLHNDIPTFPESEFGKTFSFELSINAEIKNSINIGIRGDPLKKEISLDTGFSFNL